MTNKRLCKHRSETVRVFVTGYQGIQHSWCDSKHHAVPHLRKQQAQNTKTHPLCAKFTYKQLAFG